LRLVLFIASVSPPSNFSADAMCASFRCARPGRRLAESIVAILYVSRPARLLQDGDSHVDRTERLIRLFHRRWSVLILAELARSRGSKLVTLHTRLGASPGGVREALDDLIEQGLVIRNPGYGHPLRPEYVLTEAGESVAASCVAIEDASRKLRVLPLITRKWPLPVLDTLGAGTARFNEIARHLRVVTDRALAQSLKSLDAARLVERRVEGDYPPVSMYGATRRASGLIAPLAEIRLA
jgi:DNA-binding HxlR family transcriptional regulator